MEIMAFSKAMYSTWVYYAPDRILFDCGEGISTLLTNKIFAIQKIFLTHSHADHISGLWGFLNTRNSAMGEKEKPLEIYYPSGSKMIKKYLDFILDSGNFMKYNLSISEIEEDFVLDLSEGKSKRELKPVLTKHIASEKTFGFKIEEERSRLKKEYRGMEKNKIKELVRTAGKEEISESYSQNLLTISGDGLPLSLEEMRKTDILFHECTFLDKEDRKGENHTELAELLELVIQAKPKKLILYHISSRYLNTMKNTLAQVYEILKKEGINMEYVIPGRICRF